jgi:cytochrome P450
MFMAIRCTTLEIVASYCLDRTLGAIDYPGFQHPFITGLQSALPFFWILKYLPWLTPMVTNPSDWLISKLPQLHSVFEFRHDVRKDIDEILDNPDILQKAEHPTVYQHLLAVHKEKKTRRELTREEMFQEALALLLAGSDTVGNTTSVGVFYILHDKSVLERLTSELRTAWPDPETQINYATLEKLPYLVRRFQFDLE